MRGGSTDWPFVDRLGQYGDRRSRLRRERDISMSVMATTLKRPGPSTKANTDSVLLRKLQVEDKTGLPRDGGTEARVGVVGDGPDNPRAVPAPEQGRQVAQRL